jgi:flagellar FliL protein
MSAAAIPGDTADAERPKGKSKLILLAVPVLLLGLGAGGWFTGLLPRLLGLEKPAAAEAKAGPAGKPATDEKDAKPAPLVFLDVPEIVANLNVGARRSSFVKLKAKLELVRAEDLPVAEAAMPRLLDLFQTYLRDMRPEELRGSAGSYRLREELLARATIAATPARISDVLFTELLVQ